MKAQIVFLLMLALVFAQEPWDHWDPSPPLGPRPTPPLPPYETQNDPRLLQFQQQLGHWCVGCITRCIMWKNKDFGECASPAVCACPVYLRAHPSPFFSIEEGHTCPVGYAPTPSLRQATNFVPRAKRNIVLFLLDDLDERVSPYWQAMPFSKRLFQDQGTRFENAFSSTSVCCAARCQILTGLYGHNVGVLANAGMYGGLEGFKAPHFQNGTRMKDSQGRCINNENRILPLMLQQAGYKTAVWGKYVNGFENDTTNALNFPVPPGWDEFVIPASRGYYSGYNYMLSAWDSSQAPTNISYEYHGVKDSNYLTDVIRDKATSWIDKQRRDNDAPLFLYLNPSAPHFPITAARRHMSHSSKWSELYNSTVPTRPSFNADVSNKPFYLRNNAALRRSWVETPWTRLDFVRRMGSLMAVDEMIEAVYRKFENLDEIDNTVFIMTSDNGYNHGAFALSHKMVPYEDSIHIPLYFSKGGVPSGRTIKEPALLIDVAPTILEFANLQAPDNMDGKSWWRKLMFPNSDMEEERSQMILQYKKFTPGEDPNSVASEAVPALFSIIPPAFGLDIPPYRAIRTNRYKLAEWVNGYANGTFTFEYEAYDLMNDPYELDNIYETMPSQTKRNLMDSMDALYECSGRNCWQSD